MISFKLILLEEIKISTKKLSENCDFLSATSNLKYRALYRLKK